MSAARPLAASPARLRRTVADRPKVEPFPPGHFYSPVPSLAEVDRRAGRLFGPPPRAIPGIDLREVQQLALLDELGALTTDHPFSDERRPGLRYFFDNPAFAWGDGLVLHGMLRRFRPRRVVEVGSGHSSCATVDTVERFLGGGTACTFVEPYPELLLSLLLPGDRERIEIVPTAVQDAGTERFAALEADDVLFIDSTHVSKIGSDVNVLFLEVLPSLHPGVVIHVHDIFYPFEYPRAWVEEGRAWNEAYLLRALLAGGGRFEILLWNGWVQAFHAERAARALPLFPRNPGGSIWLRKVA